MLVAVIDPPLDLIEIKAIEFCSLKKHNPFDLPSEGILSKTPVIL